MCKGPEEGKSPVCWGNSRDQCTRGEKPRANQQYMSLEVTGLQTGESHCKIWDSE